jgi:hypothetical protein
MGEFMADDVIKIGEVSMSSVEAGVDPEIAAIGMVHAGLKDLDADAQKRVLDFVVAKLKLRLKGETPEAKLPLRQQSDEEPSEAKVAIHHQGDAADDDDENDGISSTAKKWMRRNGLESEKLSSIFSLGVDEIDLVAKSVPGKGKKERMHSVFLLKGVASYLGSGSPRFSYDQVKEALVHYDGFDSSNFAAFLKTLAPEVSGSKEGGFTLTARGLTNATALLKEMAP